MDGIAELDFASSTLGLVCRRDGREGCESLTHPELNRILASWAPIYLSSGCACFPGAAGGGVPGSVCFRPDGSDGYGCESGGVGIDVCDKARLWCASKSCAVEEGQLWGTCM
jgi:hypothetical protein